MKDKYDEAVEYLTAHPEVISEAWNRPHKTRGGCLFMPTDVVYNEDFQEARCGCLTQIRRSEGIYSNGPTPELTAAIRADERIPKTKETITVDSLPVFAEWQRRIDTELNRSEVKG